MKKQLVHRRKVGNLDPLRMDIKNTTLGASCPEKILNHNIFFVYCKVANGYD